MDKKELRKGVAEGYICEEYEDDADDEDDECGCGGQCRILVDCDDLDEIHRLLDENGIDYEDL